MASLCGIVNAASRLVSVVAPAIETGAGEGSGIRSPSHWVAWQCGVSPARARGIVSMAKRRSELPQCHSAVEASELSEDQMAIVVRHVPAANDTEMAAFAQEAVTQLSRTLRRYNFDTVTTESDDPEDPEPQPEPEETRSTYYGGTTVAPGGRAWSYLWMRAPVSNRHWNRPGATWLPTATGSPHGPSAAVRSESYLATGAVRSPLYRSSHHDVASGHRRGPAHRRALHPGPVLPDSLRRLLDCDGRIHPVFEVGGIAINLGRSVHLVPDKFRTVSRNETEDAGGPGCSNDKWLQVHHIVHWEDGGCTDTSNLVKSLCMSPCP